MASPPSLPLNGRYLGRRPRHSRLDSAVRLPQGGRWSIFPSWELSQFQSQDAYRCGHRPSLAEGLDNHAMLLLHDSGFP